MPNEIQPSKATRSDLVNEILSPQFYQQTAKGSHVTTSTEYGLIEVKIALRGELQIFGVPWASLAGESISEKHAAFTNMGVNDLMSKVLSEGFFYDLKAHAAIVLPSTFAIASVVKGKDTAHGVRYLILPTEAPKRLKDALTYLDQVATPSSHHAEVASLLRATADE